MDSVVQKAVDYLAEAGAPEYRWMFVFAGWLKGRGGQADDECLRDFAEEVLERLGPTGEHLDWSDFDAVKLEFKKAWKTRKFVANSQFFEKAVAESVGNPLRLGPPLNGWVVRVVNLGSCLQALQPGLPFMIPVNEDVARQLGTSIRTLSLALAEAIELGFLRVEEEATVKGKRRLARRLTFNHEHPDLQPRQTEPRGLRTKRWNGTTWSEGPL